MKGGSGNRSVPHSDNGPAAWPPVKYVRMFRNLLTPGCPLLGPGRYLLLVCLVLPLALNDGSRGRWLSVNASESRSESESKKPNDADGEEEVLAKHSHRSAAPARRPARKAGAGQVRSLLAALARASVRTLTGRHRADHPPARVPSDLHPLVSPLRC